MNAKPKAKAEYVEALDEAHFVVAVKEVADGGKANDAVIKALADFLDIPQASLHVVSGRTSRKKVIDRV